MGRHATLHPTPYTLHVTPYTLHPSPYTLNHNPLPLNPKPGMHPTQILFVVTTEKRLLDVPA